MLQGGGNTVSLDVNSQNVELKQSSASDLYKATTAVTVETAQLSGFDLTIHAKDADLVNASYSRYRIKGMDHAELLMGMNANSNLWGYRLEESHGAKFVPSGFMYVPAGDEAPSVIVDTASEYDNAGCKDKKQCTVHVTFGASLDLTKLSAGKYSTDVTYTATAKPKPAPTVDPTTCKSGDPQNDCQVDLDANMIPVKYTGTTTNAQWTSLSNPEDSSNQGNWYNYNQKQWANAVTVKDPSKYKNQTKVVDQSDILGYWVYIPRYAYEVMRRDGTNKPVLAQNFLIHFEKKTDAKRRPAACNTTGKDYRTQCSLDRSYIKGQPSNQGTWATHPAFTFGTKELNGIWFAKFETTWNGYQPTVLPNEAHMSSYYTASYNIGRMYNTAKTLGVADSRNVGGNTDYTVPSQNNHHLAKLNSHMVNNNDWGAATYLSASKYGAGYNKVQINSQSDNRNNGNGDTYGTTGCGPYTNGNTGSYSANRTESYITYKNISIGSLGTQQACSSDGTRAYNATLGQLASTTNNPTGIYDMSGGGYEYVAASYSNDLNNSSTSYFSQAAHPPYVNNYNSNNFNNCTFQTCGGQALYEVNNGNSTGSNNWNGNYSYPVDASQSWYWFGRGGSYGNGSRAGLFASSSNGGNGSYFSAFRVALAPTTQD